MISIDIFKVYCCFMLLQSYWILFIIKPVTYLHWFWKVWCLEACSNMVANILPTYTCCLSPSCLVLGVFFLFFFHHPCLVLCLINHSSFLFGPCFFSIHYPWFYLFINLSCLVLGLFFHCSLVGFFHSSSLFGPLLLLFHSSSLFGPLIFLIDHHCLVLCFFPFIIILFVDYFTFGPWVIW